MFKTLVHAGELQELLKLRRQAAHHQRPVGSRIHLPLQAKQYADSLARQEMHFGHIQQDGVEAVIDELLHRLRDIVELPLAHQRRGLESNYCKRRDVFNLQKMFHIAFANRLTLRRARRGFWLGFLGFSQRHRQHLIHGARQNETSASASPLRECRADPSRFALGRSPALIPARFAASVFSFSPPIGSTSPRSVISPVMATSWRTGRFSISDASAVNIATPALGPSLGTAPAGT